MREIKHRLRSHNKKEVVGYEKWYAGSWSTEWHGYQASPGWLYSRDGEKWGPEYIEHRYKDTFTGLKDKNGQEIYEGDVIAHKIYRDYGQTGKYEPQVDTVFWAESKGAFAPLYRFDGYTLDIGTAEVIGNIYQNPELLEG